MSSRHKHPSGKFLETRYTHCIILNSSKIKYTTPGVYPLAVLNVFYASLCLLGKLSGICRKARISCIGLALWDLKVE
ncbi:MAG: hypothetical protein QXR45_15390 [Candidatus Bathyarchaeia archaeon]